MARAIVLNNDALLVIKRNKHGKQYSVLPGGGIEDGESAQQACERELLEEASIKGKAIKLVYEIEHEYGMTLYFLTSYISGTPKLDPNSPEYTDNKVGQNTYTPVWVPLTDLSREPFFEESLIALQRAGVIAI